MSEHTTGPSRRGTDQRRVTERRRRPIVPASFAAAAALAILGCATPPRSPDAPSTSSPPPSATVAPASPSGPSSAEPSPSGSAPAAPSVLEVECTATGTTVASDTVAVQPDGVHVHVRSVADDRSFQIDGVGGESAPAPEGDLLWTMPPGDIRIWCGPTDPTESDWVAIRVVDPVGIYVSTQLVCPSVTSGVLDYGLGAQGQRGDPVVIAREALRGLRPGDTVEPAGYPVTSERSVRIMRGGEIAAVGTYRGDGNGGWLLSTTAICGDTGISWGA